MQEGIKITVRWLEEVLNKKIEEYKKNGNIEDGESLAIAYLKSLIEKARADWNEAEKQERLEKKLDRLEELEIENLKLKQKIQGFDIEFEVDKSYTH